MIYNAQDHITSKQKITLLFVIIGLYQLLVFIPDLSGQTPNNLSIQMNGKDSIVYVDEDYQAKIKPQPIRFILFSIQNLL